MWNFNVLQVTLDRLAVTGDARNPEYIHHSLLSLRLIQGRLPERQVSVAQFWLDSFKQWSQVPKRFLNGDVPWSEEYARKAWIPQRTSTHTQKTIIMMILCFISKDNHYADPWSSACWELNCSGGLGFPTELQYPVKMAHAKPDCAFCSSSRSFAIPVRFCIRCSHSFWCIQWILCISQSSVLFHVTPHSPWLQKTFPFALLCCLVSCYGAQLWWQIENTLSDNHHHHCRRTVSLERKRFALRLSIS